MGLQDRLDTIREGSKTRAPPETRAVMQRSIEELRASGIMDRVARVGSRRRTSPCPMPPAGR